MTNLVLYILYIFAMGTPYTDAIPTNCTVYSHRISENDQNSEITVNCSNLCDPSIHFMNETSWGWAVPSSEKLGLAIPAIYVFNLCGNWGHLSFCWKIEVVFHFSEKLWLLPFCQKIEVVFQVANKIRKLRSSFI